MAMKPWTLEIVTELVFAAAAIALLWLFVNVIAGVIGRIRRRREIRNADDETVVTDFYIPRFGRMVVHSIPCSLCERELRDGAFILWRERDGVREGDVVHAWCGVLILHEDGTVRTADGDIASDLMRLDTRFTGLKISEWSKLLGEVAAK